MSVASLTRCLRLLAFCLLLVCTPVADAASCCCKQTSAAPQATGSCCQHHTPAPRSDSTCCRVPTAASCGCCVTSAPLTTAPRTTPRLVTTVLVHESAGTDQATPAGEVHVTRHSEHSSPRGNRRMAC
ncbi:MAG: hypothetical protein ACKO2L_09525 [Planctomycetaceae bacterium]